MSTVGREMERERARWHDLSPVEWSSGLVEMSAPMGAYAAPYFYVWTKHRVYFVVVYDSDEQIGSVPRHPNVEEVMKFGGG